MEVRIRRKAARQGLVLTKSRRRDPDALDFGGYMLVDGRDNTVVAGGEPHPYSLTLEDAAKWLTRA